MGTDVLILILVCLIGVLLYAVDFWRDKAADAAFAAMKTADSDTMRDHYCRLAVMAGHRDACHIFCFAHPERFEDYHPLKPFKKHGIRMAFYDYYYPVRFDDFISDRQQVFSCSIYLFKEGEIHGIEFFKAGMDALKMDGASYHIMFMPCSNWIKYGQRFKRLDWYIGKHRPELTSGLYDVDVFESRESLHEAKGGENRVLERNYLITGNIKGKEVVIIDDILTTGQSVADYKEEIERCGGKVVAAIFYGRTFSMPPLFLIKMHVWGSHISHAIGRAAK